MFAIKGQQCEQGRLLPLTCFSLESEYHLLLKESLPHFAVGSFLMEEGKKIFQVFAYQQHKGLNQQHIYNLPLIKALVDIEEREYTLDVQTIGYSLACVTLSDKGYVGLREDTSGRIIEEILSDTLPLSCVHSYILPDNPKRLHSLVSMLAFEEQYDIIVTTGGTGIAPTDLTPEALLPLLTRRLYGFEQAMMAASLTKTPTAMISRAVVGLVDKAFVIALQGSPKAVRENIEAILPALPHALEKLHGNTADCASV